MAAQVPCARCGRSCIRYLGEVLRGREEALARVRGALALGRPVAVHGVAGIGKSTLVAAVVAEHPGARSGQSLPALSHRACHPWLQAFGWTTLPGGPPEVVEAVRAASGPGELVVLEDLQWADQGTIDVLAELVGEVAAVCTVQTGCPSADLTLQRIESLGGELVELGPLGRSVMAEAVSAAVPDLLDGEVRRVVDAAGGNPLLARVLAASVHGVPGGGSGGDAAVLAAVLTRQSPPARSSLFALGVSPGPLPLDLLEEVDVLERAGLVRRVDGGRGELVHRVFGEPDLLGLDDDERRQVHERLAARDEISPHLRGKYLLGAGRPAEAMDAALLAASGPVDRAEQADALLTAATAAKQLHSTGHLATDELDPLLVAAARALNDSTRFVDADELLSGSDVLDGPHQVAALLEQLRSVIGEGDRERAARLVAERGAVIDAAEGMDGDRARALRNMLMPWSSTRAELRELAEAQLEASASGAQRAQAAVLAGLSSYPVDVHEAMAWFQVAREEASSSGSLASELDATRNLVSVQIALGHHEDARALARSAASRAAEAGERSWAIEFRTLEVLSRFYDESDHDEALSWLSYVRTAPVRLETRAMATACLATLLADRGAVRRSAAVIEPWLEHDQLESLQPMSQAFLAWGAAQRAWTIGDLDATIRIARWVTETVPAGYPSLAGTQVVWRWAQYESGLPLTAPDPVGGLLDCAELEAAGIRLLADGCHTEAATTFLSAAESWRPVLWRCALRSRWAAGHSLALAGETAAATDLLEAVDEELDRSGVPALRPRVVASLRSMDRSQRSSSPRTRGTSLLTPQEGRVMLLIAEGLTNSEISRRLGVSVSTVNTHVRSAKRKLGARTRIEAAATVGLEAG